MGSMNESILVGVRVANNVDENDDSFDQQLIPLINGQLMMAHEFGIGYNGFKISGSEETWEDWLGANNADKLAAAETWLGLKVKLLFDPPDNGSVLQAIQGQIDKFEWLLYSKSWREDLVKDYVPGYRNACEDE